MIDNNNNNNNNNQNSWTTLLQNYISKGKQKSLKEQEEEATDIFMNILEEEKKINEKNDGLIPRFFLKNRQTFLIFIFQLKQKPNKNF